MLKNTLLLFSHIFQGELGFSKQSLRLSFSSCPVDLSSLFVCSVPGTAHDLFLSSHTISVCLSLFPLPSTVQTGSAETSHEDLGCSVPAEPSHASHCVRSDRPANTPTSCRDPLPSPPLWTSAVPNPTGPCSGSYRALCLCPLLENLHKAGKTKGNRCSGGGGGGDTQGYRSSKGKLETFHHFNRKSFCS